MNAKSNKGIGADLVLLMDASEGCGRRGAGGHFRGQERSQAEPLSRGEDDV